MVGSESLSELLHRADSALYNAKRGGRDCVRLSYQRSPEQPGDDAKAAGSRLLAG